MIPTRLLLTLTGGHLSLARWLAAADEEAPIAGEPHACPECPLRPGGEWEEGLAAALAEDPDRRTTAALSRWGCHQPGNRPCAGMRRMAMNSRASAPVAARECGGGPLAMKLYRPGSAPDVDTEAAGKVWYYLTDAGRKLVPTAFLYRRPSSDSIIGDHGWHIYGGECNGYISLDDTARSWEAVSNRIEEHLRADGWTIADRPDGFEVIRNGDGSVAEDSLTDVLIRNAAALIDDTIQTVDDVRRGTAGWKEGGAEETILLLASLAGALRSRLDAERAWIAVAVESNRAIDTYLRTVSPRAADGYGMPVDGVRHAIEDHHTVAEALWQLLDDIDTQDDACRDNDGAFRERARRLAKRRFEVADRYGRARAST